MVMQEKDDRAGELLEPFSNEQVSAYSLELYRSILVPTLLGKEYGGILYWAGKNLARTIVLNSIDEIIDFFKKTSWGKLELLKESKNEISFQLTSPLLNKRHHTFNDVSYQLEAGFLAEQIQYLTNFVSETFTSYKKVNDQHKIIFRVQWDPKDGI